MSAEGIADVKSILWKVAYRIVLETMDKDEVTDDDMEFYAQTISDALGSGTCKIKRYCRIEGVRDIYFYSCSSCDSWWSVPESDNHFKYCPNCGRRVTDDRQSD